MGFVTESSMRTDYLTLFYETLKENKKVGGLEVSDNKHIVAYLTPKGILIEVVQEEMDSQSVDEWVIFDKLIEIRVDTNVKTDNELKTDDLKLSLIKEIK